MAFGNIVYGYVERANPPYVMWRAFGNGYGHSVKIGNYLYFCGFDTYGIYYTRLYKTNTNGQILSSVTIDQGYSDSDTVGASIIYYDTQYMYVICKPTGKIHKIDYTQMAEVSSVSYPFGNDYLELNTPVSSSFKDRNSIFIPDSANHKIVKYDLVTNTITDYVGTYGTGDYQFRSPVDVAYKDGYIYVADRDNKRVSIYDDSFNFLANITKSTYVYDVEVDDNSILISISNWQSSTGESSISAYDRNTFDLLVSQELHYSSIPQYMTFVSDNIYIYAFAVSYYSTDSQGSNGTLHYFKMESVPYDNFAFLNFPTTTAIDMFDINYCLPLSINPDAWSPALSLPLELEVKVAPKIRLDMSLVPEIEGYWYMLEVDLHAPFLSMEGEIVSVDYKTADIPFELGISSLQVEEKVEFGISADSFGIVPMSNFMHLEAEGMVGIDSEGEMAVREWDWRLFGLGGKYYSAIDLKIGSDRNDYLQNPNFAIKAEMISDLYSTGNMKFSIFDFDLKATGGKSANKNLSFNIIPIHFNMASSLFAQTAIKSKTSFTKMNMNAIME